MHRYLCIKTCFQRVAHVKKRCVNATIFRTIGGEERIVELKPVENFVAKTVLVESANQFSLEELYV